MTPSSEKEKELQRLLADRDETVVSLREELVEMCVRISEKEAQVACLPSFMVSSLIGLLGSFQATASAWRSASWSCRRKTRCSTVAQRVLESNPHHVMDHPHSSFLHRH